MFTVALTGRGPSLTRNKSRFSDDTLDFFLQALDRDPATRASVDQLLAHPFLQRPLKRQCLAAVVKRREAPRKQAGGLR